MRRAASGPDLSEENMKVEPARSNKSETGRSENRPSSVQTQSSAGTSTAKAAEGANQGAFSKFLDAARETDKTDNSKKGDDTDSESSIDDGSETKKDPSVKAKDVGGEDQNDSSGQSDGGDNSSFAGAPIPVVETVSDTKIGIPQARSILHVADLERIVSAVRSESFSGSKQVTIDLKNSVLDGIRVQLTLTEQGNLKAEFLVLNEQIKKQLDARKSELESVLKDRSIKCREVTVSVVDRGDEDGASA